MRKIIGLSIAAVVSLLAAIGMVFAHLDHYFGTGIAVCAILIGTAIARPRPRETR
jgi:hypothetical protein